MLRQEEVPIDMTGDTTNQCAPHSIAIADGRCGPPRFDAMRDGYDADRYMPDNYVLHSPIASSTTFQHNEISMRKGMVRIHFAIGPALPSSLRHGWKNCGLAEGLTGMQVGWPSPGCVSNQESATGGFRY